MALPYENATSGRRAIDEMQKILREFGAAAFGTMENFDAGKVLGSSNTAGERCKSKPRSKAMRRPGSGITPTQRVCG